MTNNRTRSELLRLLRSSPLVEQYIEENHPNLFRGINNNNNSNNNNININDELDIEQQQQQEHNEDQDQEQEQEQEQEQQQNEDDDQGQDQPNGLNQNNRRYGETEQNEYFIQLLTNALQFEQRFRTNLRPVVGVQDLFPNMTIEEQHVLSFIGKIMLWLLMNIPFFIIFFFMVASGNYLQFVLMVAYLFIILRSQITLQKNQHVTSRNNRNSLFVVVLLNISLILTSKYYAYHNSQTTVEPMNFLKFKQARQSYPANSILIPIADSVFASSFSTLFSFLSCVVLIFVVPRIIGIARATKIYLFHSHCWYFYRLVLLIPIWFRYFESRAAFFQEQNALSQTIFTRFLLFTYLLLKLYQIFTPLSSIVSSVKRLNKKTIHFGNYATFDEIQQFGNNCSICLSNFSRPIKLQPCNHIFCENCIIEWFLRSELCPLCREKIDTGTDILNKNGMVKITPIIL